MMRPAVRKLVLAVHLSVSVGWVGAAAAYVALGLAATTSWDASTIRSAWVAMEIVGWRVIVPLALATVVTGLVMGLGTRWGLFRHYWVTISLTLTVFATVILLLHMPDVSTLVAEVQQAEPAALPTFGGDLFHAGIGLGLLLVVLVLNVYKPAGLTRYGWRRQRSGQAQDT
jgi:hypothetical protein